MWLAKLKTALVLEDFEQLSQLVSKMPAFESLEEMEEAAFLLAQTKELMERKKIQTAQAMRQLKDTIDYLKSTQTLPSSSFNLKL